MKNIVKLLAVVMICLSTQSFAQTFKFGHVNTQEVIALMAETDSANVQLLIVHSELMNMVVSNAGEDSSDFKEKVQILIDGEHKENKQFIAFAKSIGVLQSE